MLHLCWVILLRRQCTAHKRVLCARSLDSVENASLDPTSNSHHQQYLESNENEWSEVLKARQAVCLETNEEKRHSVWARLLLFCWIWTLATALDHQQMSKSPVICQEKWEQKNEVRERERKIEREKAGRSLSGEEMEIMARLGGRMNTRICWSNMCGYFRDSLTNF